MLAKALYDYQGNGPGELAMKSGDMVGLRWRVDDNWYYGDIKGNSGLIPSSMVQILSEQTQPAPLCRALYDFDLSRLDPIDRKECLAFMKVCVCFSEQYLIWVKNINKLNPTSFFVPECIECY